MVGLQYLSYLDFSSPASISYKKIKRKVGYGNQEKGIQQNIPEGELKRLRLDDEGSSQKGEIAAMEVEQGIESN